MAVILQLRYDTSAAWAAENPILAMGEKGLDITVWKWKTGDGLTPWNSLEFEQSGHVIKSANATLPDRGVLKIIGATIVDLNGETVATITPASIGAAPALGTDDNYVTDSEKIAIATIGNKVDKNGTDRLITLAEVSTFNGKQDALGFTPENAANKNQNNGYCGLDPGGKVPINNLPTTLLKYVGVWNASTNTPTLSSVDTTKKGNVYNVGTAGSQFGITWKLGDWLIYNESGVAEKSDNSDDVTSVNGQTGAVTITLDGLSGVKIERFVATGLFPRAGNGDNPDPSILYFAETDDSGILTNNDGYPHFYQYLPAFDTYVLQGQAYKYNMEGDFVTPGAPQAAITYDQNGTPEAGVNRANYATYDAAGNTLSTLFDGTGGNVANAAQATNASTSDYATSAGSATTATTATSATTATTAANYSAGGGIEGAINGKQATLVSGTNIKTLNSQSILGSGNIVITGGSGGGVSTQVYASATNSATSGYKKAVFSPDAALTSATIQATNATVWGEKYLVDFPVGATSLEAGTWKAHIYCKVDSATGVSAAKFRVFRYTAAGVEVFTDTLGAALPTATSTEINSTTDYTSVEFQIEALEQPVLTTDRIGIQYGFETTSAQQRTFTYWTGNGYASHISVPLTARHDSLRGIQDNPLYQHLNLDNTVASAEVITVKNLLNFTEELDNAYWTPAAGMITPNIAANPINGLQTAEGITIPANANSKDISKTNISVTNGASYTISAYIKKITTVDWYELTLLNTSTPRNYFNLATGTVGSGVGVITSVGNGWYRVSATVTATSTAVNLYISPRPSDGWTGAYPAGDGVTVVAHIFGIQLEQAAALTSYQQISNALPVITLTPNKTNRYTGAQINTFTVALGTPVANQINTYTMTFATGASVPVITWPSDIDWRNFGYPTLQPYKEYTVTITDDLTSKVGIVSGESINFVKENGGIIYYTTPWFTPSQTLTISSDGTYVTAAAAQFTASAVQVGAKLIVSGTERFITTPNPTTTVAYVSVPFPTNMRGQTYASTTWGVYSKGIAYSGENLQILQKTGTEAVGVYGPILAVNNILGASSSFYHTTAGGAYKDSYLLQWSSTTAYSGIKDLGLRRASAGLLEIYDGITNGTLKDIKLGVLNYNSQVQNSSDERLKTDIRPISDGLDKVLNIAKCVRHYEYIHPELYGEGQRTGYIAQLLQQNGFEGHVKEREPSNEAEGLQFGWTYKDVVELDENGEPKLDENGNEITHREVDTRGEMLLQIEPNFVPYLFTAIAEMNDKFESRLAAIEAKLGL